MQEEIKIIFENEFYLIVSKPAGITTTKEKKGELNTLEDFLIGLRPNNLPRNGIIHRLDKGTSGLILMAKNKESFEALKSQFKNRTVKKKYYCLVGGETSFDGSINWPIGRSKYGFGKFGVKVDGKEALTEFKLIERLKKDSKKYSLLEINLKTGRTHQIRVHLSHLRWPLVGDRLYGGETDILQRPFLHAFHLEFDDPKTGERMVFDLPLANDLNDHLKLYEKE